jgi:hypothetical protein
MDTPPAFTKFKAIFFTLGFFLVFLAISLFMRFINKPKVALDDASSAQRVITKAEVEKTAADSVTKMGLEFRSAEGGHLPKIVVPDALIEKSLVKLQAKQGHKTDKVIPGTKTFLDQQSKQHDPEQSFLKN